MTKARLATNIDEELLKQLKIRAIQENKKVNELLEDMIKKYLKENI